MAGPLGTSEALGAADMEAVVASRLLHGDPVLDLLREDDFGSPEFKKLFLCLKSGRRTLDAAAKACGAPLGWMLNLYKHADGVPPEMTPEYVLELKRRNARLTLRQLAAHWHGDAKLSLEQVERDLARFRERLAADAPPEAASMAEAILSFAAWTETLGQDACPVRLPWPKLDAKVGALLPGNLVTVAGRPGSGKSAFAMEAAKAAAATHKALYLSLEMRPEELGARAVAHSTGIPVKELSGRALTESELCGVNMVADTYLPLKLRVSPEGRTMDAVRGLIMAERPELLVIDSVNLLKSEGENERARLMRSTRELKALAMESGTRVIMLAQLSRAAEGKALPMLSDIKESGSVEEDSDVVLALSTVETDAQFDAAGKELTMRRAGFVAPEDFEEMQKAGDKLVVCSIRKNRNGGLGFVPLRFAAARFSFKEAGAPFTPLQEHIFGIERKERLPF